MIYAYEELKTEKDKEITKQQLKDMEELILVRLGFDFGFNSPRHFMDRYMRLLSDYCSTDEVKTLALQILVL